MASTSGVKNPITGQEEEEIDYDLDYQGPEVFGYISENSQGSGPDSSVIEEIKNINGTDTESNLEIYKQQACLCLSVKTIDDLENVLETCRISDFNINNLYCLFDNVIRCFNHVSAVTDTPLSVIRLMMTDYFYRIRHEMLFKALSKAFNLPTNETDTPFTAFGIQSNRTPDAILQVGDSLAVIEVTAVSNYDKAAQTKGVESAGFESKYEKEIQLLKLKWNKVHYIPVIFDMSDTVKSLDPQLKQMKELFNLNISGMAILRLVYTNLSILTMNTKEYNMLPAAVLFSNLIEIKRNHPRLEFIYDSVECQTIIPNYIEYRVSNPVYRRISVIWDRIVKIMDYNELDSRAKHVPVLKISDNRLYFMEHSNGQTVNEMKQVLKENDKPKFFSILLLDTGNRKIKASESSTGYRYMDRVDSPSSSAGFSQLTPIRLMNDHFAQECLNKSQSIDKDTYRSKLDIYNSHQYPNPCFDLNYEKLMFESISNLDNKITCNKDLSKINYNPAVNFQTLSQQDLTTENIENSFQLFRQELLNVNSFTDTIPIKREKVKQPFIFPLAEINSYNYTDLENKNHYFMENIANSLDSNNMFTAEILRKAKADNYKFHTPKQLASQELLNLLADRRNVSSDITRIYRNAVKTLPRQDRMKFTPRGLVDYDSQRKKLSVLDKRIFELKKKEGVTEDISMVRLPSKNRRTEVGSWFNKEMSHFKNRSVQSTTEGVGLKFDIETEYTDSKNVLDSLIQKLPSYSGENPDMVIVDTDMAEDIPLLKGLKREAFAQYGPLIADVKNSYLGHAAALVSRLCHSLLFYSQMSFNSERIRVDSLGYDNVILIVRGGSKIFKSKSSKLFRLIYPIAPEIKKWYIGLNSSFICEEVLGVTYLITPWQLMHESVLTDGLSFYNRVVSFGVLNSRPGTLFKEQFTRLAINVLLSFHNRRQTEVFLANLRYILLSCLGDFSGMSEIFKEFLGFNYDYFQLFLRCSFLFNFPIYFKSLREIMDSKQNRSLTMKDLVFSRQKLKNIFTDVAINDTDDMALMIYSTFLMTKAPYKRNVERASNLKGIIKIHEEYDEKIGLNLNSQEQLEKLSVSLYQNEQYEHYSERLFSNDFNIDPKYIANLGVFADSLLSKKGGSDQVNIEWIKIMSESWDSMATSTGLRGDLGEVEDFWGKKGYFVVYKDLIKKPNFHSEVRSLFNDSISDDEKRKKLRLLNQTYLDKVDEKSEFWVFHAVDKTQWRGGREIYVMDIHTKQHQQPIEKFMGYLCKLLDNELISIPSDKRTQVIHHSIFEKDIDMPGSLTWYLTLDCSKWAPKSLFVKFVILILNMNSIPSSFKTHFLNYIDKLYKKRIYFNNAEVEVLYNNPFFKAKIEKYLVKDDTVNGYYMIMPYSWVMGIFNYMSSFMHAVNQEYASYIITKSSIDNLSEETSLIMYAHSDDSGGRITSNCRSLIQRGLFLYEVNLKACNHLLSKKKSVVSRFYFEILSIIYLFKTLLALLPKFLGGIRFLPTDKGPAQDMSQAYSKCIEVIVAGADFSVAHIVMCFYSALVWRFYYNRKPIPNDFRRPVQYFGIPAAHPLMVLLAGSDSDIVRMFATQDTRMLKGMASLNKFLSTNIEDNSILPSPTFLIKVRGIQKGFEDSLSTFQEQLNDWSIKYVNFKATPFNFLNFLSKLNDPGFVGSLVNESTVRRLSRAYFLRSGNSVNTSIGNFTLKELMSSIEVLQTVIDEVAPVDYEEIFPGLKAEMVSEIDQLSEISETQIRIMSSVLSGPIQICKYMAQIEYRPENFRNSQKTLKPTHLQITKNATGFSSKFDPAVLVSYITQPGLRWALPDVRNLSFVNEELIKICENIGVDIENINPNFLLQMCRHYSNKQTKSIYLYSRVPSDLRQIKTYTSFLTFLSVNSFSGKELMGLTLKLDREIVGIDYLEKEIDEKVYIAATVLSLLTSILVTDGKGFFRNLSINPIPEIGWLGGQLVELCDKIISDCENDYQNRILLLQANYLREHIVYGNCGAGILEKSYFYSFVKSQRQGTGWYGEGLLLIYCDQDYFVFGFKDRRLTTIETNFIGKIDHLVKSFILEVFRVNDISLDHHNMLHSNKIDTVYMFGFDWSGDLSILQRREMKVGIPVTKTVGFASFMSNLHSYNLVHQGKNKYILVPFESEVQKTYKIYTVNTTQSYIIPLIEKMFNPAEFEEVLMLKGFGDIGEFIYNEILLNYGVESYINLPDFIDNFSGSRLFEIMKDAKVKKYGSFPKSISTTVYPAPRGGLLRLFYEYTEENPGNKIIKVLKNITPEFMKIRSLFPEQFTAVFSEVLEQNYLKLYTPSERKEIEVAYKDLCKVTDLEELKSLMIKIMSYWGYNSLCGMVAIYNYSKHVENYKSVRWQGNISDNSYYSSLFVTLHLGICRNMMNLEHIVQDLTLPVEFLKPNISLAEFFDSYNMRTALSCFNFQYSAQSRSIDTLTFHNLLSGFLTDDEFVTGLEGIFKKESLLSTLPMDHKNRRQLSSLYNNLKVFWISNNRQGYKLDYKKRQQRIPDNIIDPTTLYKELSIDPKPTKNKYFHGQLCRCAVSYMQRDFSVKIRNRRYKVKNVLSEFSGERIKLHPAFKFIRDINLELIQDSPDWDDFSFELDTVDPDTDLMKECLINMKEEFPLYKKSTTLKDREGNFETVYTRFHWVSTFGNEANLEFINRLRQIGENIILITDSWLPILQQVFVKVSTRHINFNRLKDGSSCKNQMTLAYALYSDECFTEEFFDKLLSPYRINVAKEIESFIHSNSYYNVKGELGDIWSGFEEKLDMMLTGNEYNLKKETEKEEQKKVEEKLKKRNDFLKNKGGLHDILQKAIDDNRISSDTGKKLNNKYKSLTESPAKIPLADILDDLLSEIKLNDLKEAAPSLLKGSVTSEENLHIMQMPKHFGLAFEQNKVDRKMFSDKRVQVELTSLHPDLPQYIGSATLNISKKLAPIIFSNFNLWRTAAKGTKFKKQNKEFLLNLLNMIINDSYLTTNRGDGGVSKHDNFWRELIENCTMYFGDEGDNFDQDEMNSFFGVEQSSRIIYNPVGYYPRKTDKRPMKNEL